MAQARAIIAWKLLTAVASLDQGLMFYMTFASSMLEGRRVKLDKAILDTAKITSQNIEKNNASQKDLANNQRE